MSGPGGLAAARFLGADLGGEGAGVVGVQERDASGGDVGGGQLDRAGGLPPAGAADPQCPAGVLVPNHGGGIWRAWHARGSDLVKGGWCGGYLSSGLTAEPLPSDLQAGLSGLAGEPAVRRLSCPA